MKTVLVKIAFIAFLRVARGNLVAALYLYRCELRRRCFVALLTVQLFFTKKQGIFAIGDLLDMKCWRYCM